MVPTLTICSDASFSYHHKVGAWACYIRSRNHLVKKGGLIRGPVESPLMAERMGIANALYIADQLEDLTKFRIVLYCDNEGALVPRRLNKTPASRKWREAKAYNDWYDANIGVILKKAKSFETRHVKGHLAKEHWSTQSARHYMNDWVDREAHRLCREEVGRLIALRASSDGSKPES